MRSRLAWSCVGSAALLAGCAAFDTLSVDVDTCNRINEVIRGVQRTATTTSLTPDCLGHDRGESER